MARLFISAAEPSGDLIAGEVLSYLPKKDMTLMGIGGSAMMAQGFSSLFPMEELSVMGFSGVLPRIRHILKRLKETSIAIMEQKPSVIVTVDAYSFHSRLIGKIRKMGYKGHVIHYVPPAVWAWKPKRAKVMSALYDHIFCIFPMEKSYFDPFGGEKATFVGHPALYRKVPRDFTFRQRYHIPQEASLINILPGSRLQEVNSLLPLYLDVAEALKKEDPTRAFILPTFPFLRPHIEKALKGRSISPIILTQAQDRYWSFHETSLAIAASGTVALELATYGVPTIIGYMTSTLNYYIGRYLAQVKYICSVNILADAPIVPELLQTKCTVPALLETATSLLKDPELQREKITQALQGLHCPENGRIPPEVVANHILKHL